MPEKFLLNNYPLQSPNCAIINGSLLHSSIQSFCRKASDKEIGLLIYKPLFLPTRQLVDTAAQLAQHCQRRQIPLLIASRVDVALAVLAAGVFLQPEDMPVAFARRILGPEAIIGVACYSLADAREAQKQGASFVSFPAQLLAQLPQLLRHHWGPAQSLNAALGLNNLPVCVELEQSDKQEIAKWQALKAQLIAFNFTDLG